MSGTVIYTRQSLARLDDLAVSRQLKECKRLAKRQGIEVSQVLTDNNYSASKRGRPAYDRLIKMVESGSVGRVIILRVDRLLRLNDELEELIKLVETRGLVVVTCEGEVDLSTPQGRLIARILVSVARSEIEVKSSRHRLANDQRAEAGLPHKGRRAYGYNADGLTIREDEALILKEIAHRFLSGYSYQELADWLNDSGHKTVMGNPFYGIGIRNLLQRKRYVGIREHDGVEYPAQWPAIFDEDTWARLQHTIRERSEKAGNRPMARTFLLTGLLQCGECGAPMNGGTVYDRKTRKPRPTYRCNRMRTAADGGAGCGKVSRGSVPVENFVKELICYRLDTPNLATLMETNREEDRITQLLERQAGVNARLDDLVDALADGTLSQLEFKRAKKRCTDQLDSINQQIAEQTRSRSLDTLLGAGELVERRWNLETDGWRRSLLGLLIDRIIINASRKLPRVVIDDKTYYFDSAAVDIKWSI